MAFYIQSCGEIVILAVIVGVLFAVDIRASEANNNWNLSVLIAFATGVWLLLAIPWFVIEKRKPGFWQFYRAITQIWRRNQNLLYLIGYFLLGDSLNTTVTVIATLQNSIVEYDILTLTYLLLLGIVAQAVGIYTFWWIQQRFAFGTKTLFTAAMIGIIVLDAWGMIGIWTQSFGLPPRLGSLALSNFLRPLRLPLLFVLADHDLRIHAARQGIPFLLAVFHHWENVVVYWAVGFERDC
ncbi:MAG: hypothetical protein Q9199_006957 [Rusavskia elegans]